MTRIIKDKGSSKRRINQAIVKELKAEEVKFSVDTKRGPISLFFLRQFLVDRLHSTGGRPKLEGTGKKRNKIPLFNDDWKKLEKIAKYFREKEGVNISSGQIASALIHAEIARIKL